jgi:4-hydroxysphinganine ceramide fatty acyl 2-hydroxylase
MPARTLPTFTPAEVKSHKNASSCYVTIGAKVFDVTEFVEDHPGGGQLILDYAGKDVTEILKDEISHTHTEAAYEILDDYHIGFVSGGKAVTGDEGATTTSSDSANDAYVHPRTGMSSAEDLSRDTDYTQDYKKHKFLDLSRPLFPQLWFGGFSKEFYLEQVHRPRHYKGGASAPLFGNFLEPLSKTPWWAIPTLWGPCVAYGTYLASKELSAPVEAAYWAFGFGLWSLVEYVLHRFLFHVDHWLPDNRVGITAHFLLHGIHHYLPMDRYRLVMPPTMFVVLAFPFWKLAHYLFSYSWGAATAVFCGGIFGYICYDLTHYFLHHTNLPLWYKQLKKYHMEHHFLDYENGFGVTSRFWDQVFGTQLPTAPVVKTK